MLYLDNNATTQPTTRVVQAMLPYLTECYFNASASTASFTGADKPRREAAAAMARLLNAEEPDCFTFTSGATESNNWVFSSFAKGRKAGRILVSAVEHASVAEPAAEAARIGFRIVEVPVDAQGIVRLDELRAALREDTALVSIMAANNETGVLQPVAEIGRLIRQSCPAALFHTDATQAVGKIRINLQGEWQDVDLLSFSAHKFHGPKGVGGLYIRPGFRLEPMLFGGGQEHGFRSGTTNTPSLAGLAAAALEAHSLEPEKIRILRDKFESRLLDTFPEAVIHARNAPRLPNTSYYVGVLRPQGLFKNRQRPGGMALIFGILFGTSASPCPEHSLRISWRFSQLPESSSEPVLLALPERYSLLKRSDQWAYRMRLRLVRCV